MIIKLGGKPISTDKARSLGFALIDVASSVDRYHTQASQARAHPEIAREVGQAARAAARAIESMAKLRALIADVTA